MTEESTPELSPKRQAALDADRAHYHAALDEIDRLRDGMRKANAEIETQRTMLAGKQVEIDDMKHRHDVDMVSLRAETLRQTDIAREAESQRVAYETLFRNLLVQMQDFKPPHEPIPTKRRTAADVGHEALIKLENLTRDNRQ